MQSRSGLGLVVPSALNHNCLSVASEVHDVGMWSPVLWVLVVSLCLGGHLC